MSFKKSVVLFAGLLVLFVCLQGNACLRKTQISTYTSGKQLFHPGTARGVMLPYEKVQSGRFGMPISRNLGLVSFKLIKNSGYPVRTVLFTFLIGAIVGFLSGLLGKGGSAITTPALQIFLGVPPLIALASPLPATLPTTLSASLAYKGKKLVNRYVIIVTVLVGIPATLVGSFFSDWVGGRMLMILTAIFILILGISFFTPRKPISQEFTLEKPPFWKISIVSLFVGTLSGLLANSGGVLFGPLFIRFLKMPTKQALACSLIVSAFLAIPGTLAHWYLGHIDWYIVLNLSLASIPFSYLGARLALSLTNDWLERIFGIMLVIFGSYDLFYTIIH